ncbi:hypothetical protein [Pedobacter sp. KLB.chiD]|uniref:hypothetical protein n=1 Tax=Pedobacter sp. KLB.chiD TaxID=3387402 RepID=UPI00399B8E23
MAEIWDKEIPVSHPYGADGRYKLNLLILPDNDCILLQYDDYTAAGISKSTKTFLQNKLFALPHENYHLIMIKKLTLTCAWK